MASTRPPRAASAAGDGEPGRPRPAEAHGAVGARVGAEAHERGVPERDLPGVAEEQREADDDERVDAGEGEDLEQEAVGHDERQQGDDGDGRERGEGPERACAHHIFTRPEPPNRPWGRTKSTTSRTTRATASL